MVALTLKMYKFKYIYLFKLIKLLANTGKTTGETGWT